jgi:hypothetical protein
MAFRSDGSGTQAGRSPTVGTTAVVIKRSDLGSRGLVPRPIALRAGPARVPKLAEHAAHSRRVQTRGMADGPKIRLVLKKEGFGFLPGTQRP